MDTHRNHKSLGTVALRPVVVRCAALAAAIAVLAACSSNSQSGKASTTTPSAATSTASTGSAASTSPTAKATTVQPGQYDQLALPILDAIIRGDFTAATANFDNQMRQTVPPDKLQSAWADYQATFGKYQSHGDPKQVPLGDLTVVNIPLTMEQMPGEFRVTFHNDGTVAGLWLLKVGVPLPTG
ncbi:DUF3887 domain-containing protein [Mycobacterium gastri]|uniref:DUF3887 domain-containing protein n=1 Tax=Mycobacterium gastri TaxID=1777 RepID=A0A1X1W1W3_MYCGS|nr:DUF3887 domain-containing protein [Mycobacterium gastri]ETW22414.1 hypothetical protein MGAST_20350 [Mycobacterium gastri 'Wayne']ORV80166.1 hypothetical protein AWC07_21825 [Mycobacterium gastri]